MIRIKTSIPGPKVSRILAGLKKKNGGWAVPHPIVFSGKGKGPYAEDIDGNVFLDFGSQICSNPLGYNVPELLQIIKKYSNRFPIKYAGQDFGVEEHLKLIEELTGISPKGMDTAFLVNSGAEAVENAIKICMHHRPEMKFSVSIEGAFHGRTLGALSLHHSKPVHRKGYVLEANKKISFGDKAGQELQKIINEEGADSVGFVIVEHFQGEGGYRIPPDKMIKDLHSICKKYKIPYIADEVQCGMGRTGKWWGFEHYNIKPDVFSSAKALQVGAVVAPKSLFPKEHGSISSTWGGGHVLDMAIGIKIIEIIKKKKLLTRNKTMGAYIMNCLNQIAGISNIRGRGLMIGFDLENSKKRDDFVIECIKNGLVVLGAGEKSIRVVPPYLIEKSDIDIGLQVIEEVSKAIHAQGFRHSGKICEFMECGHSHT